MDSCGFLLPNCIPKKLECQIYFQKNWYYKNVRKVKFAENLKRLRLENNFSQKALAEKLNVNFRTVSAWEKSICEPSLEILVKISEIFDETLEDLIF